MYNGDKKNCETWVVEKGLTANRCRKGMKYTEKEIRDRLSTDREEGAAMLLEQYAGLLWSVCQRRLNNEEDVKECVNSTFAEFCLHPERYDETKGSLKNYLCQIADRKAIDRYHDNCRRVQAEEEMVRRTRQEQETAQKEDALTEHLEEALEHLEPLDSQILRMKYYDGMSYQQIAGALGLTEGTVKMRSMRSRRKLVKILLLLLALALLAACAAVVLRQYHMTEHGGLVWAEESPVYQMAGEPLIWEENEIRFEITDAIYQTNVDKTKQYELSVYVKATWLGEETDWNEETFISLVEQVISHLSDHEVAMDQDAIEIERLYYFFWKKNSEEAGILLDKTMEINMEWEPKNEKVLSKEVVVPLYTAAGYLGDVTLYAVEAAEYQESAAKQELTDGITWEVGPSLEGEQFSIVTILQQNRDSYRISSPMTSSTAGMRDGEKQNVTLTDGQGNTYPMLYAQENKLELSKNQSFYYYELNFQGAPAGEYMLHIPYLFLVADWTSQEFELPLPQENDVLVSCDVSACFPDGSGMCITGVTRSDYTIVQYDWYEDRQELVEVTKECWLYTLEMEGIAGAEMETYLCRMERIDGGTLLLSIENGTVSFFIPREECPEILSLRLTNPEYLLEKEYRVPVVIAEQEAEMIETTEAMVETESVPQ